MASIQELRDLGDEELFERLEADKEELFNLRFQLATGQLDNPMRIKQVRHELARILTILRERHLEAELEHQLALAESEALQRGREEQARGERKGTPLAEAVGEMPEGDEPAMAMGRDAAEGEASSEPPEETERPRRRFRRRQKEDDE